MYFLYNIAIYITSFLLKFIVIFNTKIRLFVDGRKNVFQKLQEHISDSDSVIWFHCASLGEFEQGRPIIEKLKPHKPHFKIIVTFFSPSGYEVQQNYPFADIVTYLPLDTKKNAKKFLQIVKPQAAIFVKYEFWPNLLRELKKENIKTILVSGIFRENQSFFKGYGSWMKKSLTTFDHFFVQNANSKKLLENIGFNNVTISGDTRFDRVYNILNQDNSIKEIENFTNNKHVLVAGSSWLEDERLLVEYINNEATEDEKFIIAPHNINAKEIEKLKGSFKKETMLFSEKDKNNIQNAQVLIIDSIGMLTKVYSYANIAYVGGGFKTGLHNILEPATYGVPIVIGPYYEKFNEAKELVELKACLVVNNKAEFNTVVKSLYKDKNLIKEKGKIAGNYVKENTGATDQILAYLLKN